MYFFRDKSGKVLYLGKTVNLKNRIKSYFSGQKDPRISKMLEMAKDIDWQETGSEIEALILESQLIKKYRPPFNIMLRDDKQYFFVGFTHSAGSGQAKEAFPKIAVVHRPSDKNFIGPFTDGTALHVTLKLLRRIFPYCTCKQKHNNYCLNYHIGNCFGFCCLKKEATVKQVMAYKKNIAAIKEILSGKKKSLIKRFEKELNIIARKEKFEKAIELRDKIEKLKMVFENARIIREVGQKEIGRVGALTELKEIFHLSVQPRRIEGYDVSNIQGEFATGAMAVFTDGQPDKNEYRKFKIRTAGEPNDVAMLKEVLTRRFNHPEWQYPDLILIDGGKGQLNMTVSVLKTLELAIPIVALTKNINHIGDHVLSTTRKTAVKIKKLPLAVRNLILQIDAEAHRFAIGYYRKLHRKAQN